jgi:hypothetical protein
MDAWTEGLGLGLPRAVSGADGEAAAWAGDPPTLTATASVTTRTTARTTVTTAAVGVERCLVFISTW